MIWILVLGAALFALSTERSQCTQNGGYVNRRGVSGGEIARYLLDTAGHQSTPIEWLPAQRVPFQSARMDLLMLPRPFFEGRNLLAIACSAREAMLKIRTMDESGMPFVEWLVYVRKSGPGLITAGWFFLGTGLMIAGSDIFQLIGAGIFFMWFIVALLDLPFQWEVSSEVLRVLKTSKHFEIDELARLNNILKGLRWETLAKPFSIPLGWVSR